MVQWKRESEHHDAPEGTHIYICFTICKYNTRKRRQEKRKGMIAIGGLSGLSIKGRHKEKEKTKKRDGS